MSNKANRALALIVGMAIAAAVASAIFGIQSVKQLDRQTPAGSVQGYLSNVLDGRNDLAAKYLSTDSPCKAEDLDRVYVNRSSSVALVDTQMSGDQATVRVKVEMPTGGPFESLNTEDHSYRLVKENGRWLISGIPWPLWDCKVIGK